MNHYQCELRKGNKYQVVWIPEKYSKVGKILRLENDNGWEVIKVFSKDNSKRVNERSMDYKNQRKVSDI